MFKPLAAGALAVAGIVGVACHTTDEQRTCREMVEDTYTSYTVVNAQEYVSSSGSRGATCLLRHRTTFTQIRRCREYDDHATFPCSISVADNGEVQLL